MKYIANVSLVNFKGELYNDFKCMTKSDRTKNNIYIINGKAEQHAGIFKNSDRKILYGT